MEYDDGIRNSVGVAISLRDMGDGNSRLFVDDVKASGEKNPINWKFESFYTFSPEIKNSDIENMELSDDLLRDIGITVIARLLSLSGRL